MLHIALAIYHIRVLEIYISHMRFVMLHIAYAIFNITKCECNISDMRYRFPRTLTLCLGSGYFERTINNAYAFLIYTSEVRFWFPKWHQKVEPTSCELPKPRTRYLHYSTMSPTIWHQAFQRRRTVWCGPTWCLWCSSRKSIYMVASCCVWVTAL